MSYSPSHPPASDRAGLLLTAAQALFATHPFDAVSIGDIAKRAGVAYGLVAHYFGSKRGIYLAAMQAKVDQFRVLRDQVPLATDMAEALYVGIGRHIVFLESQEAEFRAIMRGGIGADEDVRQIIATLRWEGVERILTAVGAARPVGPVLSAAMWGWSGYQNESVLAWLDRKDIPREQLVYLNVQMLVANLRAVMLIEETGIDASVLDRLAQLNTPPA